MTTLANLAECALSGMGRPDFIDPTPSGDGLPHDAPHSGKDRDEGSSYRLSACTASRKEITTQPPPARPRYYHVETGLSRGRVEKYREGGHRYVGAIRPYQKQ